MNILMINDHRRNSGAEVIFNGLADTLPVIGNVHVDTLTVDDLPIGWERFQHFTKYLRNRLQEDYFARLFPKYDLIHCHNIALIGLAPLIAAIKLEIPIVYTTHDYLSLCPRRSLLNVTRDDPKEAVCVKQNCFECFFLGTRNRLRGNPWIRLARKNPIAKSYFMRKVRDSMEYIKTLLHRIQVVTVSHRMGAIFESQGIKNITILNGQPRIHISDAVLPTWGELSVSSLGRNTYEKGVDLLITIGRRLVADGVGFLKMFNRLHVDYLDRVQHSPITYIGYVPHEQFHRHLRDTRVVISASIWEEPFDLTILDAMQFGKPIVATSVGGHLDTVKDGLNGFLIEPDAFRLAEVCEDLLCDSEMARQQGEQSRLIYERHFTMERCAEDYLRLYTKLVT